MNKMLVVVSWDMVDEYIREQISMEMETLTSSGEQLEPDFKLFSYNFTSTKDINRDYVVTALDSFVGMDTICEVRDVAVEFINYNYGYGGGVEDQEEFFITHYVCIATLTLVDNELPRATSYMSGLKHIVTNVSASNTGVIFTICGIKEDENETASLVG